MRSAFDNRAVALMCWVLLGSAVAVACSDDRSTDGPSGTSAATGGSGTEAAGTLPENLDIEVELRASEGSLPLGAPFEYTVAISNHGPRSVSVPLDLVLAPPSGDDVSFYSTTLFAPPATKSQRTGASRLHSGLPASAGTASRPTPSGMQPVIRSSSTSRSQR